MPDASKKRKWRVAILANIKDKSLLHSLELPPDAYGEFESMETVRLMRNIIEADGHETKLLFADKTLPWALEEYQPDICFNDAGGLRNPCHTGNDGNSLHPFPHPDQRHRSR